MRRMDCALLAGVFLAAALGGRTVVPVGLPGGPILGLLPYAVLVLAAFAGFSRGAILGGGIALFAFDVAEAVRVWHWARALAAEGSEAADLFTKTSWHLLLSSPATTVFVLPPAMLLGGWIERLAGRGDGRSRSAGAPGSARRTAGIFAAIGTLVVVSTSVVGSGFQAGGLVLAAWALLPYGVLLLAARIVSNGWVIGGAGAVTVAAEVGIRASVFLFPRGSTAAVALVFSPVFLGVAALPAGALCGWLMGRAWRVGRTGVRAATLGVAAVVFALVAVGFARPDLLPWALATRHASLERIGPPRVVTGSAAFESAGVSRARAWFQTGDFDGRPGDEIAVVDHRGVTLLDPSDFHARERVDFGAEPGRLWNWYSKLARLEGRLVVVQTGGGFSETEIRELDGRLVWRHRPDPKLPPRALLPAELDADGRLEFYVADGRSIARLDGDGRDVWRAVTPFGAGLVLSESSRTGSRPGWVVSFVHPGSITIRDHTGAVLAKLPAGEGGPVTVGEWKDRRVILTGTSSVRGLELDASAVFDVPLGDFTLSHALTIRFAPAASPHVAILAAAPREVHRWRLVLISSDETIVYDEILEKPAGLLRLRGADGRESVLVSGDGLRAIRPRRDPSPAVAAGHTDPRTVPDPVHAFVYGTYALGDDYFIHGRDGAVMLRCILDANGDGLDDLALSELSIWGNRTGPMEVFLRTPSGTYDYDRSEDYERTLARSCASRLESCAVSDFLATGACVWAKHVWR